MPANVPDFRYEDLRAYFLKIWDLEMQVAEPAPPGVSARMLREV